MSTTTASLRAHLHLVSSPSENSDGAQRATQRVIAAVWDAGVAGKDGENRGKAFTSPLAVPGQCCVLLQDTSQSNGKVSPCWSPAYVTLPLL